MFSTACNTTDNKYVQRQSGTLYDTMWGHQSEEAYCDVINCLQVNHSPSFGTDTPLDLAIKKQLIFDTLGLVRVNAKQLRRGKAADRQQAAERLLRAKGRATCDQPSAVSLDEMQSLRCAGQVTARLAGCTHGPADYSGCLQVATVQDWFAACYCSHVLLRCCLVRQRGQ